MRLGLGSRVVEEGFRAGDALCKGLGVTLVCYKEFKEVEGAA